ncbi:MAG: EamA family transporter RarD [Acidimicrobiales bacterium]
MTTAPERRDAAPERRGALYGISAYAMWGLFPLYFALLGAATPLEIVLHRVLWSLVVCIALVTVLGRWDAVRALRSFRVAVPLAVAAVVLALNWGIYVYSVGVGQVTQASLGYYINPLVTVVFGVVFLGERLRPAQWVAVAFGAAAVLALAFDYGSVPWISLGLAASFGTYGLIKKQVGAQLPALISLTGETLALAPVAVAGLLAVELTGRGHFGVDAPVTGLLLVASGAITAAPLLLFAGAARRLPLAIMGLLQYLTPTLQLLVAVLVLGETMPASRWIGFGLVWVALLMLIQPRRARITDGPSVGRDQGPAIRPGHRLLQLGGQPDQ